MTVIRAVTNALLVQKRFLLLLITGAPPQAGTGLKMQMVRFFNVTLLGIYCLLEIYRGLV